MATFWIVITGKMIAMKKGVNPLNARYLTKQLTAGLTTSHTYY